jgi:hypothetical protein
VKLLTSKSASWVAILVAVVAFLAETPAHTLLLPLVGDATATTIVNVAKLLAALLGATGASVIATRPPTPPA